MAMHPSWRMLILGVSVFLSFGVATILLNRYEAPFLLILGCFCFCLTGFVAAVISGVHIMANRHIRRNAHLRRNKCCDETTSLLSANHGMEEKHFYTDDVVINVGPPYASSDPWPIPQQNHPYDHPSPMLRKSYLVEDFMLMFFRLAGLRRRRVRSNTISEGVVRDSPNNVSVRRRSRTWSVDDVENQLSLPEESNYETPSRTSNKSVETIIHIDDGDELLYVTTKKD